MNLVEKMNTADELGLIQAQIAELRKQEAEIKGEIFESGTVEGDLYKATLIEAERTTVNWKKIAIDLGASPQKIRANSVTKDVVSVKVTALSTAAKRAA
jgi:hypothetical protein